MVDTLQISSGLSGQVSLPQYSVLKTWATLVALVLSASSPQFGHLPAFHWLPLQVLHPPNYLKPASWNSHRDEMSLFKIKFYFDFFTISEDYTLCLKNHSFKYIYIYINFGRVRRMFQVIPTNLSWPKTEFFIYFKSLLYS